MVVRRGIVAGSLGAVVGGALGGAVGSVAYRVLDPLLEAAGSPLEELQGIVASLVLVGTGGGLALGCGLALRLRHHDGALLTTVVLLAALPFAAPLVALAGRLHAVAALLAGVAIVVAVVAAARFALVPRGRVAGEGPEPSGRWRGGPPDRAPPS
ncbi:MAG: hypothetical protein ACLFV0_12275 [Nitriliruptoraceae bacterium]